jgi:hypothetical protein
MDVDKSLSVVATLFNLPFLLAITAIYVFSLVIYRHFFHPLAHVPGPFLGSVTKLYLTYYNRQFFRKFDELHAKYGILHQEQD